MIYNRCVFVLFPIFFSFKLCIMEKTGTYFFPRRLIETSPAITREIKRISGKGCCVVYAYILNSCRNICEKFGKRSMVKMHLPDHSKALRHVKSLEPVSISTNFLSVSAAFIVCEAMYRLFSVSRLYSKYFLLSKSCNNFFLPSSIFVFLFY